MKMWAKVSSIFVTLIWVILLIGGIYDLFFSELSIKFSFIYSILIVVLILSIVFYTPLFYYGFNKKTKSKTYKNWARVSTSLFILILVLQTILLGINLPFLIMGFLNIMLLIPLGYYAWKK